MANASDSLAIFTFFPFHLTNLASKEIGESFPLQSGGKAPVFFGDEILNLPLPLADDPNGNGLDPTCAQSPSAPFPKGED